jgi:hypothetical protein
MVGSTSCRAVTRPNAPLDARLFVRGVAASATSSGPSPLASPRMIMLKSILVTAALLIIATPGYANSRSAQAGTQQVVDALDANGNAVDRRR